MKKHRRKGNPPPKSPRPDRDMVEKLTAAGLNADAVAQILNVNKNKLRAAHALALANGRATLKKNKANEAAAAVTSEEKFACDAILAAFEEGWSEPDGNLLWRGLDGSGARSPPDALAAWMAAGGKFITVGLDDNFSRERLEEFAAVKAAAQKLLKARQ